MIAILGALSWLNPKRIMMIVGAIVISFTAYKTANFIDQKYALEQQVYEQSIIIQNKDATIISRDIQIEAIQAATVIAEKQLNAARQRAIDFTKQRQNILNSSIEDDGEVAPVLANVLESIRIRNGSSQ